MRLPPLNALRAFEAAARLGGFARAGAELNVSPGAVSRHVKLLEAHLGVALFERLPHGLRPTPAARSLLPGVAEAFEGIRQAVAGLPGRASRLHVAASPTLAGRSIVPRLPHFAEAWPDISLSVALLLSADVELDERTHDCGVATFHVPCWPAGIKAVRVKGEALTPLCAPSLLRGRNTALRPEALSGETLLRIAACGTDWPNWFAANGVPEGGGSAEGPSFESGELAIRAAIEGLGIVIMDRLLVTPELQRGDLVDLFPDSVPVDNGYYFFCAERRWDEPAIRAFRTWIQAEFAEMDAAARQPSATTTPPACPPAHPA